MTWQKKACENFEYVPWQSRVRNECFRSFYLNSDYKHRCAGRRNNENELLNEDPWIKYIKKCQRVSTMHVLFCGLEAREITPGAMSRSRRDTFWRHVRVWLLVKIALITCRATLQTNYQQRFSNGRSLMNPCHSLTIQIGIDVTSPCEGAFHH